MTEIILAISSSIIFSISHLTVRQGVTHLGTKIGTLIMLIVGTITAVIISILIDGVDILFTSSKLAIFYFFIAGMIHFIGGWGFMNASSNLIGAARFGAMASLTPMFASLLAFLTFRESINFMIVLGILLITGGMILTTTSKT